MKIELFVADFIEDQYQFEKLPYHGSIPNEFHSNGFTYTPNEIRYNDTRFFLYCNHELNDYERKKLETDWRTYCPE
jgi:hypothetical protein